MKTFLRSIHSDTYLLVIVTIASAVILAMPTGFEDATDYRASLYRAGVISVDNSTVRQYGLVKTGAQKLAVFVEEGPFKGQTIDAVNHLSGKMEIDSVFSERDSVLINISRAKDGSIISADVREHFRIHAEIILALIFAFFLVIFAGWTGVKAVISFLFTGLVLWKILIPSFLNGYNPLVISLAIVTCLCATVIFLVSGLSKKGSTAFAGTAAGIITTAVIAGIFSHYFRINGAVRPFSEMLLYSGFPHLSLNAIFLAGVYLASSGALMDLAMDISAAQHELIHSKPDINRIELIRSGMSVGRVVVGTMTTTLLLAYSGGYTALLMIFMAKGGSALSFFNNHYVANEIFYILAGSIGLVATAPLTAIAGGIIFVPKLKKS